ncbi:sensor domain-containing protein [Noviherbaspirillum galbum]|uniref:EAL domain-containing protein n=1 Tax=Noviherbaspirillum galbum TaxID=2709383 RepID=A0A6B3SH02_9BURK|nr:bifunctional diguanylate cyclase/phosphodiesterase [Noviherbaspirillum galbum]NEX59938.1 EAL domain-containing protein [Noviherbaspirillum galbum]
MRKIKSRPATRISSEYIRLHAILDSLNEGVLMYDLSGTVIEANQAALDFLSATTKEEIDLTKKGLNATFEVCTVDGIPVDVEHWPVWRILQGEEISNIVLWVRNKRTGRRWISSHSGKLLRFPDADEACGVLSIRDITESKTAELQVRESESRLKSAFESFIDQIIIVDQQLQPQYMNPAARKAVTSMSASEAVTFWHSTAKDAIRSAKPVVHEVQCRSEFGLRDYTVCATPLLNAAGTVDEVVILANDSTEKNQAQENVRKAALHDILTGLPNRALLYEHAKHMFATAKRLHQQVAVLFIDLDRFKPINDIYGHETGDKLLRELADRLRSRMREEDIVARFGGDEFVILLPEIDQHRPPHVLATDLLRLISKPVGIDGNDMSIEACIGISLFPHDGEDIDELLRRADTAMYSAKASGRNEYRFYTDDLASYSKTQSHLEYELKRAIGAGGLSLAYQPIVDIDTGKILCAEALIRWDEGTVGPDIFVPIAEMSGLVGRMTEWVLDEVGREQHFWRQHGLPLIPISVNVSPVQFKLRGFIEDIERRLRDQKLFANLLQIELTETVVMENAEHAIRSIKRLREHGIKVALDDFGKGYSSLSYLSRLPIDKIKIDKEFILGFSASNSSRAITDAIIALGTALQLEVVAEGIETLEMLMYVRQQGCRQAQGFYICKPVNGELFAKNFLEGLVLLGQPGHKKKT